MTTFECGCPLNPQYPEQRCAVHRYHPCHYDACGLDTSPIGARLDLVCERHDMQWLGTQECPPCRRQRLLSVNLSPSATPTRKGR